MPTKKEIFTGQMKLLSSAYGRDFDKDGMRVYNMVLGCLDEEQLVTAFKRAMEQERFCPPPAVIMAYAPPVSVSALPERPEGQPTQQWTKEQQEEARALLRRIRRHVTVES